MKRSNQKLRFLYFLMFSVSLLIIGNVFLVVIGKVHIRSNTSLENYVTSVSTVEETIFASRGKIYDCNGIVVAEDVETYDIICFLDSNRLSNSSTIAYVDDPSYAARMLAPILDMEASEIYDRLTQNSNLFQTELGANGRNLSKLQVQQIQEIDDLHGIEFRNSYERYYAYGSDFAPYLIGFAQSDETGKLVGKMGLEAYLNSELSGTDGLHEYQQDKNGYVLPGMYEYTKAAKNGYDIYLTLDVSIQEALMNSINEAINDHDATQAWGAVMEVKTGKILAWGQSPSFDPNTLDISDYNNYGSSLAYEPGSVMKAIIYAAAIDMGVYDGDALFNSNRYYYDEYGDLKRSYYIDSDNYIANWDDSNWGYIPLDYGLIYSSNVATATLLTDYVGVDAYKEYIDKFHFFEYVNTDGILETEGITNYGLSNADSLNLTFGQGSSVTTLQLLQAYSAIFGNGEMIKPYFINKISDPNTNNTIYEAKTEVVGTPIKESTAKTMQDLLRRVVSDPQGTGKDYNVNEVEVMCKTGTAEVAVNGIYTGQDYIKSAMCAFPYEDPQYIVYFAYHLSTHKDYGTKNSPIAELISKTALLTNTSINLNGGQEIGRITRQEMPNVVSKSFVDACDELEQFKYEIVKIGDGSNIVKQYPEANKQVYTGQKVYLLTDGNTFYVPNFNSYTRKEIINYWNISGLRITIEGSGVCYEQSISPGTIVSKNDEIKLYLKDIEIISQEILQE